MENSNILREDTCSQVQHFSRLQHHLRILVIQFVETVEEIDKRMFDRDPDDVTAVMVVMVAKPSFPLLQHKLLWVMQSLLLILDVVNYDQDVHALVNGYYKLGYCKVHTIL